MSQIRWSFTPFSSLARRVNVVSALSGLAEHVRKSPSVDDTSALSWKAMP
ncbi:hypothetical protein APASM_5089 [Actinosynnema pretiosum subsp. pretiosum]|nr:hypothetical protein APASM_5089 [Actinosynnema pretiosum subsp. pretiosum]